MLRLELLRARPAAVLGRLAVNAGGARLVQVLGGEGNDVVVVGELARLGGEAQVRDRRDLDVGDGEALGPSVLGLVLELELEGFLGEVGQARLRGDGGVADATGLLNFVVSWCITFAGRRSCIA